ncbi:MAG: hypothetical protein Q7J34_05880 [Bacteroidales bacterium]|jgi:chromosome segregation ATPase|nr:hypothetical protein [Bacteroidales bacterium]
MKKLIFLLIPLLFVACKTQNKEIEKLQSTNDSLTTITQLKDESVLEFVASFNDIQKNLDSIKNIEKIISLASLAGNEKKAGTKDRIIRDINSIHELVTKNKKIITSLREKLKNFGFSVVELETMINNLTAKIEEKDAEIKLLKSDITKYNLTVESLSSRIDNLEEEKQRQERELDAKNEMLNTAYYAIGTKKELIANNIVRASGGFLGIGKSNIVNEDLNKAYFTKINIKRLGNLPLMVKKAKVITTHPLTSFYISGAKTSDTLFITDYKEFWSTTKYLVIMVD